MHDTARSEPIKAAVWMIGAMVSFTLMAIAHGYTLCLIFQMYRKNIWMDTSSESFSSLSQNVVGEIR